MCLLSHHQISSRFALSYSSGTPAVLNLSDFFLAQCGEGYYVRPWVGPFVCLSGIKPDDNILQNITIFECCEYHLPYSHKNLCYSHTICVLVLRVCCAAAACLGTDTHPAGNAPCVPTMCTTRCTMPFSSSSPLHLSTLPSGRY